MSTSAEHIVELNASGERRFYRRIIPSALIYIAFGENNVGMLLNVSENGLLISTPMGLNRNFVYRVSIRLNGLPRAIEVHVRIVWTTGSKERAGIQLLDLCEHDREQIRKWGALESLQQIEREQLPVATDHSHSPYSDAAMPLCDHSGTLEAIVAGVLDRAASDRTALPTDVRPGEAQQEPQFRVRQAVREPRAKAEDSALTASMWVAVPVVIALGIILLIRSGALRNPLIHSAEDSSPAIATKAEMPRFKDPNRPIPAHGAAKTSNDHRSPTQRNTRPESALSEFPAAGTHALTSNGEDVAKTSPAPPPNRTTPATGAEGSAPSDATERVNELNMNSVIPPAAMPNVTGSRTTAYHSETRHAASNELANELSRDKSVKNDPAPNTNNPNDLSTNEPLERASIAIVASTRAPHPAARGASYLARKSGVVHMDAPGNEVMDVHSESHRTSFVALPGERLLESASVTMRIQRSVLVPGEHKWWPSRGSKKVTLGELLSRVDPQISQLPISTNSTVIVRAAIAKDGHIESVQPMSGSVTLVATVVKAIHEWHYQPTLLDGKPVETQADVEVQFHAPTGRVAKP
jgi:hypothetical protein